MVRNIDLFRKMMKFSKELKISAFRPAGKIPGLLPHPIPGMMPPPPPFGPRPPHRRPGMSREHMLGIISEYPDGIRQKELAERAGINASSTSEVVTKLEDDGYLIRTIDPSDKRATVLRLTEMGAVRAEEIKSEHESFIDEYFGRLTDEEKQTLSDLLDKLIGESA